MFLEIKSNAFLFVCKSNRVMTEKLPFGYKLGVINTQKLNPILGCFLKEKLFYFNFFLQDLFSEMHLSFRSQPALPQNWWKSEISIKGLTKQ